MLNLTKRCFRKHVSPKHLNPSFASLENLEPRQFMSLTPVVPTYPIITYNSTGVLTYDSQSEHLDITATALFFRQGATTTPHAVGGAHSVALHVMVDNNGQLAGGVAGDDFVVAGDIDTDGDGIVDKSGILLTGEVRQFGFQDISTTDKFEFVFAVTGGQLASLYAGQDIGMTVSSEHSSFAGSFTTNFGGGAKGNIGSTNTVFTLPPEINIVKSGPVIAQAGDTLKYDYVVTNPSIVSLSNVTVTDDQAGPATYVSGDTNGDNMLQPDETWLYTVSYQPQFKAGAALTNVATATGTYLDAMAQSQASYTLTPVVLHKQLFLYWNSPAANVPIKTADNTAFSVDISKDGSVIDTVSISQSQPAMLWVSDGAYTFQETDLPDGYLSTADQTNYATTQGPADVTIANVATFNLGVDKTGPATATAGQKITYTYEVTNTGPGQVTPVLNDDKTGTPTYVSGDTDGNGLVGPTETWIFTSQYTVPGSTTTATTTSSIFRCCCPTPPPTPAPTSITNTVTVDAAENPHAAAGVMIGGDTDTENNVDTWTVQIGKQTVVLGSLSGNVFIDWNNNGVKNCPDVSLPFVKIILTGVDDTGAKVRKVTYTDCRGAYKFAGLRPGVYSIEEVQPCGLQDGIETVGSLGGKVVNNIFTNIVLTSGAKGTGYNFAELFKPRCRQPQPPCHQPPTSGCHDQDQSGCRDQDHSCH